MHRIIADWDSLHLCQNTIIGAKLFAPKIFEKIATKVGKITLCSRSYDGGSPNLRI